MSIAGTVAGAGAGTGTGTETGTETVSETDTETETLVRWGDWGDFKRRCITGFDAEACWPLNGPLFSLLNPLYSLMGVGVKIELREG